MLFGNLLNVVGEWAGFNQRWLEERILERGPRRRGFAVVPGKWMVRGGWKCWKPGSGRRADDDSERLEPELGLALIAQHRRASDAVESTPAPPWPLLSGESGVGGLVDRGSCPLQRSAIA